MKTANIRTVINWEFKKHLRSPAFLLFTFALPALLALAGFLPSFVAGKINAETQHMWVLDETNVLTPYLEETFSESRYKLEFIDGSLEQRKTELSTAETEGLLYINDETLTTGRMQLFAKDIINFNSNEFQQLVQPAFTRLRLQESGISPQQFSSLLTPATLALSSVSGETDNPFRFFVPLLAGLFLFVSLLFSGQVLMQSVIKEKRNRIVEILLSSLSAGELLAGKILAFGGLALIQIGIWLGAGLSVASRFFDLGELGIDGAVLLQALPYFILGYLMLASFSAAMAAMMKDAESGSQVHGLIFTIPVLPIMLAAPITMAPNGFFARLLSFIPIFTPATMFLRIGITQVPLWELVATSALLLVATVLFLKLGARIYQGSLLNFSSATSLKEAMGMLKREKA